MVTMKSLKHGAIALLLVAAFITVGVYEAAAELQLLATTGKAGCLSVLIELDPNTGETIREIGPVGYAVNGMAWDQTNGKLYGTTSENDPYYTGLIEIDPGSGAGTPIGLDGWGLSGNPVTTITVNSSTGQMFGWQRSRNLVSVNKNTGIATVVGSSNVSAGQHGLAFDNTDNTHPLYLVDAGGAYYTINTSTAQGTYQGDIFPSGGSGDDAHHGVFHPYAAKIYFGLTTHWDGPIELVRANLLPPGTVISRVTTCCDCVHTLAFIEENSCILDLDLDYDYGDNELDIEFTLRERAPAMLSVWLHLFYQDYFLGAVGLPPIDPRTTVDISLPLPNCGNVGVLATLATENAGIACSAWKTVDTGN